MHPVDKIIKLAQDYMLTTDINLYREAVRIRVAYTLDKNDDDIAYAYIELASYYLRVAFNMKNNSKSTQYSISNMYVTLDKLAYLLESIN